MRILILGGFLGSGKTSILIGLAKHVIGDDVDPSEAKVVILENEIGEVGVDDVVLSSSGLSVQNMFAGCICCSLSGELVPTLFQLRDEYSPELVIIESTGVACPKQIRDTLLLVMKETDIRICTVVDAKRWDRVKIPLSTLLQSQLADANTVLLNKIDLVDEGDPERIIEELREINPEPKFAKLSAMQEIDPSIWEMVLGDSWQ